MSSIDACTFANSHMSPCQSVLTRPCSSLSLVCPVVHRQIHQSVVYNCKSQESRSKGRSRGTVQYDYKGRDIPPNSPPTRGMKTSESSTTEPYVNFERFCLHRESPRRIPTWWFLLNVATSFLNPKAHLSPLLSRVPYTRTAVDWKCMDPPLLDPHFDRPFRN